MRIACLVPSATDLVAALGFAPNICGISHECDHPAVVRASGPAGPRVVTRPRVASAPAVGPGEVDAEVRQALAAGDSLYVADREALAELAPDLVVGQAVCDVCAVTPDEARRALPRSARLFTLSGTSLSGLKEDVRALAEALGAEANNLMARVDAAFGSPPALEPVPTVVALEWSDPPFLGGHWVPELVARAGGRHLISEPGAPSRTTTYEAIADAQPTHVVFMPCGYDLTAAAREARACAPMMAMVRASGAELWATDANRLFSRLTPNAVVDGVRALSAILRGEAVDPGAAQRIDVGAPSTPAVSLTQEVSRK